MMCEVLQVEFTDNGDILRIDAEILPMEVPRYKKEVLYWEASGVHLHADNGGFTDLHKLPNYNAIVCRSCHLRVQVPKNVVTIGDLIEWRKQRKK